MLNSVPVADGVFGPAPGLLPTPAPVPPPAEPHWDSDRWDLPLERPMDDPSFFHEGPALGHACSASGNHDGWFWGANWLLRCPMAERQRWAVVQGWRHVFSFLIPFPAQRGIKKRSIFFILKMEYYPNLGSDPQK